MSTLDSAEEALSRSAAIYAYLELSNGNPGTLVLGRELEEAGHMRIEDLVSLAESLGLKGNSLNILHKVFGRKDLATTAEILAKLREAPNLEKPLVETGEIVQVKDYESV